MAIQVGDKPKRRAPAKAKAEGAAKAAPTAKAKKPEGVVVDTFSQYELRDNRTVQVTYDHIKYPESADLPDEYREKSVEDADYLAR